MTFLNQITPGEYLQAIIALIGFVGIVLAAVNRWAVANQRDRLAMFTSAAGNAAGRIREALNGLPPGANAAAVKQRLLSSATTELLAEFDTTAAKIGATPAKAQGIIEGQLADKPIAPGALVPAAILSSNVLPLPMEVRQTDYNAPPLSGSAISPPSATKPDLPINIVRTPP